MKSKNYIKSCLIISGLFLGGASLVSSGYSMDDASNAEIDNSYHPLARAINSGDVELTRKLLANVEDINSKLLLVPGYRQGFSMVHLALSPSFPKYEEGVSLDDRLAIVDLLAAKDADFNDYCGNGMYNNPPLTADSASTKIKDYGMMLALQARALIYRADPLKKGTSFRGLGYDYDEGVYELALNQYYKLENKEFVKLAEHTKSRFEKIINKRNEMNKELLGN